jgi:predicted RNA-binding Zn-ribbon protein involved in translation (DUF1610 family)
MPDEPPPLPTPDSPIEYREPTLSKAPPSGKRFPCVQCGAKVTFDPRSRSLKCPYCGHEQAIADSAEEAAVVERKYEEAVFRRARAGGVRLSGRSSQVRCSGCGAVVLLEDTVVTENCPYCGTHLDNQPEHAQEMIAPESLIPFGVDLRQARDSFEKWLHGLWFAPSELKRVANLGQLNAVYVPYWTYDAMTYTRYSGMRGDNYTVTETYTSRDASGNPVTRTRTVTKVRWRPVSGEVQHFFDDVLVCASRSVPPHLVRGLEPWDLHELEPFKDEFLAGLKTERYAIDLEEGLALAKELMQPTIDALIRQDIGGDHQRIIEKRTRYLGVTFKHCLLPVWTASYRYHDKLYQILINGRTGRVSGERPWSWWKILRLVAIIALVLGLIAALTSSRKPPRVGKLAPDPDPTPTVTLTPLRYRLDQRVGSGDVPRRSGDLPRTSADTTGVVSHEHRPWSFMPTHPDRSGYVRTRPVGTARGSVSG